MYASTITSPFPSAELNIDSEKASPDLVIAAGHSYSSLTNWPSNSNLRKMDKPTIRSEATGATNMARFRTPSQTPISHQQEVSTAGESFEVGEVPCSEGIRSYRKGNFQPSEGSFGSLSGHCKYLNSLPPMINIGEEDDEDDDEDIAEIVEYVADNSKAEAFNFCSDLMDFDVGTHPDNLELDNLTPSKFSGNTPSPTDEEFVPSPVAPLHESGEQIVAASSSLDVGSTPVVLMTTSTTELKSSVPPSAHIGNPVDVPDQALVPPMSTLGSNGVTPDVLFTATAVPQAVAYSRVSMDIPSGDWLCSSGMAIHSTTRQLQQQEADAVVLQEGVIEMQRLQKLQQRSFALQPSYPQHQADYPECQQEQRDYQSDQHHRREATFCQYAQKPLMWATNQPNLSPCHSSPKSELKGPLTTAQAAAISLSRRPPSELSKAIARSKEFLLLTSNLLDTIYTSSHEARRCSAPLLEQSQSGTSNNQVKQERLVEVLTDVIEKLVSTLSCVAPEYLEMIIEERSNAMKRPLMLAHPDEFKNPSSFLKIYGDPQCNMKNGSGPNHPRKGRDGNWECSRCQNVNYPRRFRCNNPKCKALRDSEGDKRVSEYTRQVFHLYLPQLKSQNNSNSSMDRVPTPPSSSASSPPLHNTAMMQAVFNHTTRRNNVEAGKKGQQSNTSPFDQRSGNNSNSCLSAKKQHHHMSHYASKLHSDSLPAVAATSPSSSNQLYYPLGGTQFNDPQTQMLIVDAGNQSILPVSRPEFVCPTRLSVTLHPSDHSPVTARPPLRCGKGNGGVVTGASGFQLPRSQMGNFFF